jgi:hypothetical protein
VNPQLPLSIEEALPQAAPKPLNPLAGVSLMAALWGLTALALHAVIWPAQPAVAAAGGLELKGLTADNVVDLTGNIVTALAADQLSSALLKVQLAQQVVERLRAPVAPQPPASPAAAR